MKEAEDIKINKYFQLQGRMLVIGASGECHYFILSYPVAWKYVIVIIIIRYEFGLDRPVSVSSNIFRQGLPSVHLVYNSVFN